MKLQTSGFFSAAHWLTNYEGPCQNFHGHTYAYYIEIEKDNPKLDNGMLVDFSFIKKTFDHKLIYNKTDYRYKNLVGRIGRIDIGKYSLTTEILGIDGNPTAENMAKHIKNMIKKKIDGAKIIVRIWEDVKSLIDQKDLQDGKGEYIEV